MFGGDGRFAYTIRPLDTKAPPTARFAASFKGLDLASFTDFQRLNGLRFAGTASGESVVLEWPLGKFADHHGSGHLVVEPPAGVQPMTASLAAANAADADHAFHEWGPFAPGRLPSHLPVAGDLAFRFDPEQVYVDAGRFATEHTNVTFQGSTAWGNASRLAFHVTSGDWQESDQLLAGIMSDFGAPRTPVTFGGRGEFDGTMAGPFRSPKVEGEFSGDDLRGFDTLWGGGSAHITGRERLCAGGRWRRRTEELGDGTSTACSRSGFPARTAVTKSTRGSVSCAVTWIRCGTPSASTITPCRGCCRENSTSPAGTCTRSASGESRSSG